MAHDNPSVDESSVQNPKTKENLFRDVMDGGTPRRASTSDMPAGSLQNSAAVRSLPHLELAMNKSEEPAAPEKPQLVINPTAPFDDDSIKSVANGLASPAGGMTLSSRERLMHTFKNSGQAAEDDVVTRLNKEIKDLGNKSTFSIQSVKDDDGIVTKTYKLNQVKIGDNGKEIATTKNLFQVNYDKDNKILETEEFIAGKLADGKVTDKERALIESSLQAAYRDNAAQHPSGFALGAKFQAELQTKIQDKLKELNPNLELAQTKSSLDSPTAFAYKLHDKKTGISTTVADAELDLEKKDNDVELAKYYANHLAKGSLTKKDLSDLRSTIASTDAMQPGGAAIVAELIDKQLEKIDKSISFSLSTDVDDKDGSLMKTASLTDKNTGRIAELFHMHYNKNGERMLPEDFIASRLVDGQITDRDRALIAETIKSDLEDNAALDHQFARSAAYLSKLMKNVGEQVKTLNPDLTFSEGNMDVYKLQQLSTGKVVDFSAKDLVPKDSDAKLVESYAKGLANGSPTQEVVQNLDQALNIVHQDYGTDEVNTVKNLINLQLKKLKSDCVIVKGKSAQEKSDQISFDLLERKKGTSKPLINITILPELPPA